MRKYFTILLLLGPLHLYAQCPTDGGTIIEVCNDAGGEGTIIATFNDGTPPFTYQLFDLAKASFVTEPLGPVTITELAPNKVQFGLVPNGDYVIRVNGSSCYSTIGGMGINVNSANYLNPQVISVIPSCSANTGEIDIDVTGGAGPYTYSWTKDEDPAFTASTQDLVNQNPGTYNVTVTDAKNCIASIEGIVISVISTAMAGADQTICADETVLGADPPEPTEVGEWTDPDGVGVVFSSVNDPNASVSGLPVGTTRLIWTVKDSGGACPGTSDEVLITRELAATVDAGTDQVVCSSNTVVLSGTFGGSASSAQWSTNGDGVFGDPNDPSTTYTPGPNDIAAGTVDLALKTNDPAGVCPAVSETITITIEMAPTASAGSDEEVCAGDVIDLSTSSTPPAAADYSALAWTTGGDGTFNNSAILAPVYTPGPGDISSGTVTLTLEATGNGACGTVTDNVVITITPSPSVQAGTDQEVCEGSNFDLSASGSVAATNFSSLLWSTSGDGSFADATVLTPVYTPGAGDIGNGTVTLTLQANGNGSCAPVTDNMILTITPAPTANAGSDESICEGDKLDFTASGTFSATNYQNIQWATAGDGSFNDPTVLATVYTPGANDIATGSVVLTLTATGNGSCAAASDDMTLTITPAPAASAGSDEEICAGESFNLSLSTTAPAASDFSSLLWSSSGDGTFDDNASLTPVYTPGTADINAGTVQLTLQAAGNGSCQAVTDVMTLTIIAGPVVSAGSDEEVCGGVAFDISTAATQPVATNYSSLSWTTSGDGTFNNNTVLTPVYTPGPNDNASGSVTLTLEAAGNGSCPSANDEMLLTITPAPTVSAGSDEQVCEGIPFDLALSGTQPGSNNTSGLEWSTSGDGSFTDVGILTPVYTPGANDIASGSVILTLKATGNGTCAAVTDNMQLTITPAPVSNAGSDEEVCAGSGLDLSTSVTAPSAANYNTLQWSTTGDGTFDNSANLTPVYTPGSNDIINEQVLLILEATGNGTCSSAKDTLMVTITPSPTVNAGDDVAICEGSALDLSLSATVAASEYSSLSWSTSGDGSFDNVSILTPVYTPGPADISAGTVTLSLQANPNGSCAQVSDDLILTISPNPAAFIVSGGGDYCEGSPVSYNIDLNGSAVGVDYSLMLAATLIETVAGTGSALNFTPQQTAGTYTVVATTVASGCTAVMDGNAEIIAHPVPTATISGSTTICEGSSADIRFDLAGTSPWNVQYSDGTNVYSQPGVTVPSFLINVTPSVSTTYTLVSVTDANCNGTVSGTATITVEKSVNTGLTVYADPAGTVCSGGSTEIKIENSQTGITYQLRNDADDSFIGDPLAGNGNTISLPTGSLTSNTTFNILAASAACGSAELDQLVAVNVAGAIDPGLNISAADMEVCENETTTIDIENSENGVTYQLRFDADNANVGTPVTGNGSTISLSTGSLTATTIFNVLADNGTCQTVMSEKVTVDVNTDPDINLSVSADPGNDVCTGAEVSIEISGSETGISYQLRNDADDTNVGSPVVGNGSTISLSAGALNATTSFNVLAIGACSQVELANTITVNVTGTINSNLSVTVTEANICEGSGTDIQINNSEVGVSYQLRNDADNSFVGSPVNGDGATVTIAVASLESSAVFNVLATNGTCSIEMVDKVSIDVDPTPLTDLAVVTNPGGSICSGGNVAVQVIESQDGVRYQLRNDADDSLVGSEVAGTGGTINLPTGTLNTTTTFNVFAISNTCASVELTNKATVNVLSPSDPACGGGGGGTGECATVIISFPEGYITPATCTNSDGEIIFKIDPFVPATNNTGVTINIDGPVQRTIVNDSIFSNLPKGVYTYTIEYGDPSCVKTGSVTIDQSGTVGAPVASNIVGPDCFGGMGVLNLDVPGETGNVLQWSVDGTFWNSFVAGEQIQVPAGPSPSYQQVIAVRRSSADLCNASVTVQIKSQYEKLNLSATTTEASCDNNDGSIVVKSVSGGSGTYSYRLDGIIYDELPDGGVFNELAGGSHVLTILDENVEGCERDFNITVPFPGLVSFDTYVKGPDCSSNEASNGEIDVVVRSIGQFQVGISTDHAQDPSEFFTVVSDGNGSFTFSDLSVGDFYITVVSTGATCPNRRKVTISDGPAAVSFNYEFGCLDGDMNKDLKLVNIKGGSTEDYELRILKRQNDLTYTQVATIAVPNSEEFFIRNPTVLSENAEFKLTLAQQQAVCPGQELTFAHPESFVAPEPLQAEIDTATTSLPDRETGEIIIGNFSGGNPDYFTKITLDSAAIPGQVYITDFEAAEVINGLEFESVYNGVPAGRYTVEVKDALGCIIPPLTARVELNREVWIPNIFTPNGDEKNEIFYVRNLVDGALLLVTNRWGNVVYSSESYQNDWDAEGVPDGIYYYKLDNGGRIYTGWVEVMRGKLLAD